MPAANKGAEGTFDGPLLRTQSLEKPARRRSAELDGTLASGAKNRGGPLAAWEVQPRWVCGRHGSLVGGWANSSLAPTNQSRPCSSRGVLVLAAVYLAFCEYQLLNFRRRRRLQPRTVGFRVLMTERPMTRFEGLATGRTMAARLTRSPWRCSERWARNGSEYSATWSANQFPRRWTRMTDLYCTWQDIPRHPAA